MSKARDLHPHEVARIENALLELFAAFGQSLNSIQNSLQTNKSDGLVSTEIVLPSITVMGLRLAVDHTRPLGAGMYIRCKKPEIKTQGRGPEANA